MTIRHKVLILLSPSMNYGSIGLEVKWVGNHVGCYIANDHAEYYHRQNHQRPLISLSHSYGYRSSFAPSCPHDGGPLLIVVRIRKA